MLLGSQLITPVTTILLLNSMQFTNFNIKCFYFTFKIKKDLIYTILNKKI
jgi:hypothetical protein